MDQLRMLKRLNAILLGELPEYRDSAERFGSDLISQRRLLRSLMNVRPPWPLDPKLLALQDQLLAAQREEKGVVDVGKLSPSGADGIYLWRGDITRLNADGIVNAANAALLGCFCPCHGCIDNAIHSAAGMQLRDACSRLMARQGQEEPVGRVKVTPGYNLPCRYVLHTVGPRIAGRMSREDGELLAGCYRACMEEARARRLKSLAFCCISTGEYRFPQKEAAQIAVETVKTALRSGPKDIKVIFDVFTELDEEIYRRLLQAA